MDIIAERLVRKVVDEEISAKNAHSGNLRDEIQTEFVWMASTEHSQYQRERVKQMQNDKLDS